MNNNIPTFDPDSLARMHDTRPSEIFVVMDKALSTVLKDPGMDRPWSSKNRKLAEDHARQVGGIVVPLTDAIQKVIKHPANLPRRN